MKKSLPVPELRWMNVADRTSKFGVDGTPSACGRLVVPCRFATPETMLKGSAE